MPTEFISPTELARRLGVAISTLDKMRAEGSGPTFYRISGGSKRGRIGYATADVEKWLSAQPKGALEAQLQQCPNKKLSAQQQTKVSIPVV